MKYLIPAAIIFCVCFTACKKNSGTSATPIAYRFNCDTVVYKGETDYFLPIDSTFPTGASLSWQFGDGSGSSSYAPDHVYNATVNGSANVSEHITVLPTVNCPYIGHLNGTRLWNGQYERNGAVATPVIDSAINIQALDSASILFLGYTLFCTGYSSVTNSYAFSPAPFASTNITYYCTNDSVAYHYTASGTSGVGHDGFQMDIHTP